MTSTNIENMPTEYPLSELSFHVSPNDESSSIPNPYDLKDNSSSINNLVIKDITSRDLKASVVRRITPLKYAVFL
jgi:hypothetical protein